MAVHDAKKSVLLENVIYNIGQKFPKDKSAIVEKFVNKFYGTMEKNDLQSRNDSDLYGSAISLWNALNELTSSEKQHIKVYNPELAKHGWQSTHTIIEIILEDLPFLVDSIRMALSRMHVSSHLFLHQPLHIQRGHDHKIINIFEPGEKVSESKLETVMLIEIDRQTKDEEIKNLTRELMSVIKEVEMIVYDWQPMLAELKRIIEELPNSPTPCTEEEVSLSIEFLKWIVNGEFTLMGYRQYDINPIEGDHEVIPNKESSLGLMKNSHHSQIRRLNELPQSARHEALSGNLLVLTKTNTKSRVHRPAYIDYIGIKRFDTHGKVIGEDRFIGLFSASIYNISATQIPLINRKVHRVMKMAQYEPGSHSYKAMLHILERYPRDEIIQAKEDDLLKVGKGILTMQDRDICRLFIRRDVYGRFFSCMVYVTKDRYSTTLRKKSQQILKSHLNGIGEVEFTTNFSESNFASTHYIVRVENNNFDIDLNQIQNNLIEAARMWSDKLEDALRSHYGESEGNSLAKRYEGAFPPAYREEIIPGSVVADIAKLESLSENNRMAMLFYQAQEEGKDSKEVKLKLFLRGRPIYLSEVLPTLENMGLTVVGETPYHINVSNNTSFWILDFTMLYRTKSILSIEKSQSLFQDAFASVWNGFLEDDGFNTLVLQAGLTGREVSVLRAYAKYMKQTGVAFSQSYVEETLGRYPEIAQLLFKMFKVRFSPKENERNNENDNQQYNKTKQSIIERLEHVENLDDDRIIRRFMESIEATTRTNFYQTQGQNQYKSYISFKLEPSKISEIPQPVPMFEIFVYSPKVEGVHLRWGKVARGGLRWSDRREDFRTEVLGLVKAQQVKNTVIVPVGAKGGFFCKNLPKGDREAAFEEGKNCYRTFIRGLLDVTDNIIKGEVKHPVDVVRHDENDYYLVVAADKGTATFSDIANEISIEYGHWLGDAFASGGSVGYDHKKMGITARGAWESVKRHFREMGIDCQATDFTCVGIGDMGGDVFGNGMLLSKHIRLVAAFNHMHIFIDPEPDTQRSYKERERLFNLPRSTWADYDASLISTGGGVFSRSLKSIRLTDEMKRLLHSSKDSMTPNEMIKHILRLNVDLLWNGGIGTYVKSEVESDTDVGDRSNDSVRVNGKQLNAKIVGEGGNLGFTQLGRIEYASKGGRINTDFTDNVGGVDCSDNEVNIKILLNQVVEDGDLTVKQRNDLLYKMTENVANIVLKNAYRQSQTITVAEQQGVNKLKEFQRFIQMLEREGALNRELEFLPTEEEFSERLVEGKGLTRPEISVLVAYAKMVLKERLNCEEINKNEYLTQVAVQSFPDILQKHFYSAILEHPLRAEIVATRLANTLVDDIGVNFVLRMEDETGATSAEIAICCMIVREVFNIDQILRDIEKLDNQISSQVQADLLYTVRRICRRMTRWFLRARDRSWSIDENIKFFKKPIEDIKNNLSGALEENDLKYLKSAIRGLVKKKVPEALAEQIAQLKPLFSALDIVQISSQKKMDVQLVANVYYTLGAQLGLHWFVEQINQQSVSNHWQVLARSAFREDLEWQQRALTSVALEEFQSDSDWQVMLSDWVAQHDTEIKRWLHMLSDFKTSSSHEFAKFSVALRELNLLQLNCRSKS